MDDVPLAWLLGVPWGNWLDVFAVERGLVSSLFGVQLESGVSGWEAATVLGLIALVSAVALYRRLRAGEVGA